MQIDELQEQWVLGPLLPNLVLPSPSEVTPATDSSDLVEAGLTLGASFIAIVPSDDARIVRMAEQTPAIGDLLKSVRDSYNEPVRCAVLITRATRTLTREAVVNFRNALALAVVLRSRARYITGAGRTAPNWTDTFDYHPTEITRDGRIVSFSTSMVRSHATKDVLVAQSPYVSEDADRLPADVFLVRTLGSEWRRRFAHSHKSDEFGQTLFRSLELAYHAASVPVRNAGSLHDFGVNASLWVAAIEALAWPAKGKASEDHVRTLLRAYPWARWRNMHTGAVRSSPFAAKRYTIRRAQRPDKGGARRPDRLIRVDALERSYHALYRARNNFLHGEPFAPKHLLPWGRKRGLNLVAVGALLYRMALRSYLAQRYQAASEEDLPTSFLETSDELLYQKAMREIFPAIPALGDKYFPMD